MNIKTMNETLLEDGWVIKVFPLKKRKKEFFITTIIKNQKKSNGKGFKWFRQEINVILKGFEETRND